MSLNEVGLYGIAYRFATMITLLTSGFQLAVTPVIYSHYKLSETPNQLEKLFRYFLLLSLMFFIAVGVFSRDIVSLFTSAQYYSAAPLVPILMSAILLRNMYIFAPGLGIAKKTNVIAGISVASAITNIVLNFVFIPLFGIKGAAIATTIGAFLAFFLYMRASQALYYVPHNWLKISGMALMSIICVCIFNYVELDFKLAFILKLVVILCVLGIAAAIKFVDISGLNTLIDNYKQIKKNV